jgi:F-box domain
MNINNISRDCLYIVLGKIELCHFYDVGKEVSYLNNLSKCSKCYQDNTKCLHLHESEAIGRKILRLVCKRWKIIIDEHYRFISGPSINVTF